MADFAELKHDIQRSNYQNVELLDTSQAQSLTSKLWDAAYEHRAEIGTAAGTIAATAAVVGLAALTKGKVWGKPNVLLIEDTKFMGMAYKDALEAAGNKVTWVTKVSSLKPMTGITAEGAEVSLSKRWQAAFLDGELGKGNLQGIDIAPALRDRKIFTIATSSQPTMNAEMMREGASIAGRKDAVYTALLDRRLDVRLAAKAPLEAQGGLDKLTANMRAPELKELRERANAQLMKFMNLAPEH